jgi:hypothetical protein
VAKCGRRWVMPTITLPLFVFASVPAWDWTRLVLGNTVAKMAYTDLPGSRCFLNPRKCAKGPAAQAPVPPPLILLQLLRRAAAQEVGTW